jgi:hypothetical protein
MSNFTPPALVTAPGTFAAFRHRNYRLWFTGQLVSLTGTWMQNIAQGYLLYTLTGSVAYLGLVSFISGKAIPVDQLHVNSHLPFHWALNQL